MNLKVKGLDGRIYPWNPTSNKITTDKQSTYYEIARKLLKSLYGTQSILEEVSLPGTRPTLYADFVISSRRMIIEVNGEQHYNHVLRFHPTDLKFANAKKNDINKKRWCNINNFYFIELPYYEDVNAWRERITNASITDDGQNDEED